MHCSPSAATCLVNLSNTGSSPSDRSYLSDIQDDSPFVSADESITCASDGAFSLASGGRYSDIVERYMGGYAGADRHGDSAMVALVMAVSSDSSEASLSSSSSWSTTLLPSTFSLPKICVPNPKEVISGVPVTCILLHQKKASRKLPCHSHREWVSVESLFFWF